MQVGDKVVYTNNNASERRLLKRPTGIIVELIHCFLEEPGIRIFDCEWSDKNGTSFRRWVTEDHIKLVE